MDKLLDILDLLYLKDKEQYHEETERLHLELDHKLQYDYFENDPAEEKKSIIIIEL